MLLPTSLVGSYPQPEWLIDRARLSTQVPRVRAGDLWRVAPEHLEAAQDDATILAIRDQERAGLDIITDGEQRRESYSNRFATALDGVDVERPGTTLSRTGGPLRCRAWSVRSAGRGPVVLRDLAVLRANTGGAVKATVPGPFTLRKQAQDDFYDDAEAMALDYAAALNAEIKDLFAAGADIVQIDEPWMQQHPAGREALRPQGARPRARRRGPARSPCICASATRPWCTKAVEAIRSCPSWKTRKRSRSHRSGAARARLPDLQGAAVEDHHPRRDRPRRHGGGNAETSPPRIRRALDFVPAERLVIAPDCGMKYLPRPVAFAKMKAMADGAALVRREIAG